MRSEGNVGRGSNTPPLHEPRTVMSTRPGGSSLAWHNGTKLWPTATPIEQGAHTMTDQQTDPTKAAQLDSESLAQVKRLSESNFSGDYSAWKGALQAIVEGDADKVAYIAGPDIAFGEDTDANREYVERVRNRVHGEDTNSRVID